MAVFFKLSSWNDDRFDTIQIDEAQSISVPELRARIIAQKSLEKDIGMVFKNAQSQEEYSQRDVIPKQTSVVVSLVPKGIAQPTHSRQDPQLQSGNEPSTVAPVTAPEEDFGPSLWGAVGAGHNAKVVPHTEEDKLAAVIAGGGEIPRFDVRSGVSGGPENMYSAVDRGGVHARGVNTPGAPGYVAPRPMEHQSQYGGGNAGHSQRIPGAKPPSTYICKRCQTPGHYIYDCPTNGDHNFDVPKRLRNHGVPRSRLANSTDQNGHETWTYQPDEEQFARGLVHTGISKDESFTGNSTGLGVDAFGRPIGDAAPQAAEPDAWKKAPVPQNLKCPLCGQLFDNAVMFGCCGESACDNCATQALSASSNVCPLCSMDCSPEDAIANQNVRRDVEQFKSSHRNGPPANGPRAGGGPPFGPLGDAPPMMIGGPPPGFGPPAGRGGPPPRHGGPPPSGPYGRMGGAPGPGNYGGHPPRPGPFPKPDGAFEDHPPRPAGLPSHLPWPPPRVSGPPANIPPVEHNGGRRRSPEREPFDRHHSRERDHSSGNEDRGRDDRGRHDRRRDDRGRDDRWRDERDERRRDDRGGREYDDRYAEDRHRSRRDHDNRRRPLSRSRSRSPRRRDHQSQERDPRRDERDPRHDERDPRREERGTGRSRGRSRSRSREREERVGPEREKVRPEGPAPKAPENTKSRSAEPSSLKIRASSSSGTRRVVVKGELEGGKSSHRSRGSGSRRSRRRR